MQASEGVIQAVGGAHEASLNQPQPAVTTPQTRDVWDA